MGLSSSAQKQQQPKQYQQNNMYIVDKLKSALAINKRKNPTFIDSLSSKFGQNLKSTKRGTYKTLNGNKKISYEAVRIIGKGSFGIVYSAKNQYGQIIAIKCKKELADAELMEKSKLLFRDELEALYNLNHINILKLIGVELKSNEAVSLIMEYIVGTTLDNIIRTYRNLNESAIQSFVKQIVDGVAYMHMQFVMHRDIKSSNIMIVAGSLVKIIDFGMAKHFDFSDKSVTDYDMSSSTVVGTVPYMAPELINFGKYNSKVDIWSIGVISYEMANGDVFVRQRRSAYGVDTMSLSQANGSINLPNLSTTANNFIQSCLIKNADYRPPASVLLTHPFIRNAINPAFRPKRKY